MTALITRYGALAVFALMVPEAACLPLPSEVTLVFAGVAVRAGWMNLWLAVLAATAGNLVGALLAYGVGWSGLPSRLPRLSGVLTRFEEPLRRSGLRGVLVGRLLPLARTFISLPAGALRLPLLPFALLTAVGSALWAFGLIGVGIVAGNAWAAVSSWLGKALLGGGLVVAVWLLRRHPRRRGGPLVGAARHTVGGEHPWKAPQAPWPQAGRGPR